MPEQYLTDDERAYLLALARKSIDNYLKHTSLPSLQKEAMSKNLREQGASFITLTYKGYLRGCVGALDPYQSLAEDVREHAIAAAFQDFRFPPVQSNEMKDISIEISYLTQPKLLSYENSDDLLQKIRPEIDGVVIQDGVRRATFLPQVWEKILDPSAFMNQLSLKLGVPADFWRTGDLTVETYQVQEFHE